MVTNINPEALIWTNRIESVDHWRRVADYLVARLGHYLQLPVVAEPLTDLTRRSFSCGVRGLLPLGGALQLEWSGVLALEHDEDGVRIAASLVLFSHRRRLQVTGHVGSSLELLFERGADGRGYWSLLGWQDDIYGVHEDAEL